MSDNNNRRLTKEEIAKKVIKPQKEHPYNVFVRECGTINPSNADDGTDDSDSGTGLGLDFSRPTDKTKK